MRKRDIKYGGMLLGKEEKAAIKRVVDKNWWPLAEEGEAMEREAAEYLGVKYGVLANSGSSAGLLALKALELPRGSEVIIPAVTFPTIFNIILQCGLKPVVADCEIGTYNLDLDKICDLVGRKTRAIIAVHAVGNPVDMKRLMAIAKIHNLIVLEDNCDGWGGDIDGKMVGSFGDISFTSFHAAHIVSMGQGGGVFTDNKEYARRARMYRDWGRQSDLTDRINTKWDTLPSDYDARFIYEKVGYNLSPLELQAAMGRVQLKKTGEIKRKRRENYEYLRAGLSKYNQLILPSEVRGANPSWFALPLTYTGNRGALVSHLEENGIETRSMFAGNILKHPAYRGVKHRKKSLAQSNVILEHSFWIGVHPRMTKADRDYVLKVFDDYFTRYYPSRD